MEESREHLLADKIRSVKVSLQEICSLDSSDVVSSLTTIKSRLHVIKSDIDTIYQQHSDMYFIDKLKSTFDQILHEVDNETLDFARIKFELNCFKGVVKAVMKVLDRGNALNITDEDNQMEISPSIENDPMYQNGDIKIDIRLSSQLTLQYSKLLNSKEHSDVTFIIDGHSVHAHRIILAAQSEYFERLLFGSLSEARKVNEEINLQDVTLSSFQLLMCYAYTGCVKLVGAKIEGILNLLETADRFLFVGLKNIIAMELSTLISAENVVSIFVTADHLQLTELLEKCLEYIDRHATDIVKQEAILLLPQEQLINLLSRDTFVIEELSVYNCITSWMRHNSIADCPILLECVRLTEIPSEQLLNSVHPDGRFTSDEVISALKIQTNRSLDLMKPRGISKIGLNLFELNTVNYKPSTSIEWRRISSSVGGQVVGPPPRLRVASHAPFSRNSPSMMLPNARHSPAPLTALGGGVVYYQGVPDCPLNQVILCGKKFIFNFGSGRPLAPGEFSPSISAQPSSSNSSSQASNLCVTIALGGTYLLNYIKFEGNPQISSLPRNDAFTYSIEVSTDGNNWHQLVNYMKYNCYKQQEIWFTKQAISEIKFTLSSAVPQTTLQLIKCSLENDPQLYKFHQNGLMAPQRYVEHNVTKKLPASIGSDGNQTVCYLQNTPLVVSSIRFNVVMSLPQLPGTVFCVVVRYGTVENSMKEITSERVEMNSQDNSSELVNVNFGENAVVSVLHFTVKNFGGNYQTVQFSVQNLEMIAANDS